MTSSWMVNAMTCKFLKKENCALTDSECNIGTDFAGLCYESWKKQLDDIIEKLDDKSCFDLLLQQIAPYSYP
jgi:hypothetical protein